MVVENDEVMVHIVVNDLESAVDLEAAEYGFSASQAGGGLDIKIAADHSVEGVERIAVLNDLRMAVVHNAEYLVVVLAIDSMVAVDLIVKIRLHRLCAYFPAERSAVDDLLGSFGWCIILYAESVPRSLSYVQHSVDVCRHLYSSLIFIDDIVSKLCIY